MKRIILLFIFIQASSFAFSQPYAGNKEIEKLVNEQVWKPFKKAFESKNSSDFNELHTDDVIRISKWSGIRVGSQYKESVIKAYQTKDDSKRTIDFCLEHRIYSDSIGYEVGYYRIKYEQPEKETKTSYARFHVALRKIDGKWKIAQDWDIDNINGVPVTKEDFEKNIPLELN